VRVLVRSAKTRTEAEVVAVSMTKAEKRKLKSYRTRAEKISRESRKLATDVGKELVRQMKKS